MQHCFFSIVVYKLSHLLDAINICKDFELAFELSGIELITNFSHEQGRFGFLKTLNRSMVVNLANKDPLVIGHENLYLFEIKGREEAFLDVTT